MSRKVIYLIASIVCIVLPILTVLYAIWDFHQPKTGPVGDGKFHFKLVQWLPTITTFLIGLINVPRAIVLYRKQKETNSSGQ
ncbi:hypothetical protein [Paenibacillus silvisoli]|uniref:hypothetical protein n=1 Tax=Paenibacillus silvisoli TaxID=3110539 RepID=UPI00280497C4|nr:hypothetical protein [Paenibacillus silvisoli]